MDQDAGIVNIISRALERIGDEPIISLEETKPQVRRALTLYAGARKRMLRDHPWNFAIAEVELARVPTAPTFKFKYAFQLPADLLRLLEVQDTSFFKRQGQYVLSDESVCKITYIKDVEDPALWDASFADAFTYQLAAELSYGSSGQASISELNFTLAAAKLQRAKAIDATEDVQDRIDPLHSPIFTARF